MLSLYTEAEAESVNKNRLCGSTSVKYKSVRSNIFLYLLQAIQKYTIYITHRDKLCPLNKIHKPDAPIRSIVNFRNTRNSQTLGTAIRKETKLETNYSINNNLDLIHKLGTTPIQSGYRLTQFYIKDLSNTQT